MLTRLHVRNLAVLDEVEVELHGGFGALTGETGAGKSMLVDALGLALGSRADSSAVRSGAEKAEVTAIFDLTGVESARAWLAGRDFAVGEECQLRRVITAEGRSRGYIDGQPVPLELLRELGEQLVEICGQHAHQSLARRATQREILDAHGNHEPLLEAVARAWHDWQTLETERQALLAATTDRQSRRDLLDYQVGELRSLGLQPGEFAALDLERIRLANAGRIGDGVGTALDRLYDADDGSAYQVIGGATRELGTLVGLDPDLQPAVDALTTSLAHVADAADVLRRRLTALEHDPGRLDAVETRLSAILDLARRHRCEPEALCQRLVGLEAELDAIGASDERLEGIAAEAGQRSAAFATACGQLHRARVTAAASLGQAVTVNLHELGMPAARFSVDVDPAPPGQANVTGTDQIEFRVSTHGGVAPGPVARVASGGELSRLSLAVQVVAMAAHGAPTLVFDEVDAGIGGGVAEIVGRSLRRLSRDRQVLCVTHLAQVASQADQHLAVTKADSHATVRTTVRALRADERIEEIARMLGGVKITDRTRAHAREMLAGARPRRAG